MMIYASDLMRLEDVPLFLPFRLGFDADDDDGSG
jgi:hypothetical protein